MNMRSKNVVNVNLKQLSMIGGDETSQGTQQVTRTEDKVGRNDPCPCGSGKKYKKCCGS